MSSSNQTVSQIITVPRAQLPVKGITAVPGDNPTVINTFNIQATPQNQSKQGWSTGLFGCFSDIPVSCGVSGAIYAGICHFLCCVWVYTMLYRTKMRNQYNLPESPCPDCCAHYLCHKHALCQEHRELKNRGFDLSIGWQANIERMNGVVMMAPGAPLGMTRGRILPLESIL